MFGATNDSREEGDSQAGLTGRRNAVQYSPKETKIRRELVSCNDEMIK